MTDYREQAILDVAAAIGGNPDDVRFYTRPHTSSAPLLRYAVAQREIVLELKAQLTCKASTPSPRSLQEALEQALLPQKGSERG